MGEFVRKVRGSIGIRKSSGLLVPLISLVVFGACVGGGGSTGHWLGSSAVAPNPSAPTVTAVFPADNATGIPTNRKMTATFSEDMTVGTINTTTVKVATQAGVAVAGTTSYVSLSRVVTFAPDTNLLGNTNYIGTVTTGVQDLAGNAMTADFTWTFRTAAGPDSTAPRVISTVNDNGDTDVPINTQVGVTFSEEMDPTTLSTATFRLNKTNGGDTVTGVVTYAGVNALFDPTGDLLTDTFYTARVTTGAKDLAGNPLAADSVWTWRTALAPDTIAPRITLVIPAGNGVGVCRNRTVSATFNEPMDPLTITNVNFSVRETTSGNTVAGVVAYDLILLSNIATFTPNDTLLASTQYTATVTTAVKDLAGNTMAVDTSWVFTTGTNICAVASSITLGTAAPFGGFGGSAGVTNEGLLTVVNGDLGTTGASTLVTGFRDSVGDIYTVTPLNDGMVNGRIYTAAPPPGGAGVGGNGTTAAIATQALSDANAAYIALSPAAMPGGIDPNAGQLGGLTLAPGIYQAAGGSFLVTGSDLTLDAGGDANGLFVFQMGSTLTVGGPGAPRNIVLQNGAQAKNVYWQVGSSATINAAGGGTMVGTIISSAATTFSTSGNVAIVTLNGRALALNASTTMTNTVINVPAQ